MNKNTVLLTGPVYEKALKKLEAKADVQFIKKGVSETEIINLIKKQKITILIVRGGKINKQVINSAPNLKAIIKHGVGVNNIDIKEAKKRNIPVFYTPNANYESVAEHALALILDVTKHICCYNQEMKKTKEWCQRKFQPIELKDKTVGLIGLGRIARRLSEFMTPFPVKIFAYDPFVEQKDIPHNVKMVNLLDQLLRESDIISIHCPLTSETENLIDANRISKMKKGVYVINTARGPIIDENALISALKNGKIAGAGLDTFAQEPLSEYSALYDLESVVLTPHIGGTARESFIRMGEEAVDMAIKIIENRKKEINSENIVAF